MPAIFHWPAASPRVSRSTLALELAYLGAALLLFLLYRWERRNLPRAQALALIFLIFLLTSFVNNLHFYNVDRILNFFPYATNAEWQRGLQNNVINLLPAVAPHSYRFLPNALVRWLEIRHVSFETARDIYRLFSSLLLFYALYRYARLFTHYAGAIIALLLTAAVYPVSFENYAGQLTDPLSHLSFVLSFIFIATGNFPLLLEIGRASCRERV